MVVRRGLGASRASHSETGRDGSPSDSKQRRSRAQRSQTRRSGTSERSTSTLSYELFEPRVLLAADAANVVGVNDALDEELLLFAETAAADVSTSGDSALVAAQAQSASTFSEPLEVVEPLGALIYRGSAQGAINNAGDIHEHTIDLEAGQTATVVVSGDSALEASVEFVNQSGTVLASDIATVVGGKVVLQTEAVNNSGTYTVRVQGANATTGNFSTSLVLNAAIEEESLGGAANNSRATAQDINGSFINLGFGSAKRAAVTSEGSESYQASDKVDHPYEDDDVLSFTFDNTSAPTSDGILKITGWQWINPDNVTFTLSAGTQIEQEIFTNAGPATGSNQETTIVIPQATLAALTSNGQMNAYVTMDGYFSSNSGYWIEMDLSYETQPRTPDFYEVALDAGQSVSFAVESPNEAVVPFEVLDGSGNILASSVANVSGRSVIDEYQVAASGDYYVRVLGPNYHEYSVVVTVNAEFDTQYVGDPASDLETVTNVLGSVGGVTAEPKSFEYVEDGYYEIVDHLGHYWEIEPRGIIDRVVPEVTRTVSIGFDASGSYNRTTQVSADGEDRIYTTTYASGSPSVVRERKIYSPEDGTFIRFIDTVTNTSDVEKVHYLTVDSFWPSDIHPAAVVTSSGDADLTAEDQWWTVNAEDETPSFVVFAGDNDQQPTLGADYRNDPTLTYELLLGPGESAGFMHFVGTAEDADQAAFKATQLAELGEGALEGITAEDRAVVINFQLPKFDRYDLAVNAGDLVYVRTKTPSDGGGAFDNQLDPLVKIYDPNGNLVAADDNGRSDGRNVLLSYDATIGGDYTVEVSGAQGTTGEYVLEIHRVPGGLPPAPLVGSDFAALAVDPLDGATSASAVSQMTIDFNDQILLTSVQASDLTVNGQAATAVTVVDGDTLLFDLPVSAAAHHLAEISGGAIVDLQGEPLAAFASEFVVDTVAPHVISSSLNFGDVVPWGNLAVILQFNEELDATTLDASDVFLTSQMHGDFTPTTMSYDTPSSRLVLEFEELPEDRYTFTLASGDDAVQDLVGHDFDGEVSLSPGGPLISGDGTAGGDFVVEFVSEGPDGAFPLPLEAASSFGSLVYRGSVLRAVGGASDVDTFTIDLDAGQVVSLAARPSATLRPQVELLDPNGASVAVAMAAATGEAAIIQMATAATAGTYTVRVSGNGYTAGAYELQLALNAGLEEESLTSSNNNSVGTAQSLDVGETSLGFGNASISSVLGQGDGTWYSDTVSVDDLSYTEAKTVEFQTVPGPLLGGRLTVWGVGSYNQYGKLTWLFGEDGYSRELFNDRNYLNETAITTFELSADQLAAMAADGTISFGVQSYMPEIFLQLDYLVAPATGDYYEFDLAAGEVATLVATGQDGSDVTVELLDDQGNVLSVGTQTVDDASYVDRFVAPASDTYYARVMAGPEDYNLSLVRNATVDLESNSLDAPQPLGPNATALGAIGGGLRLGQDVFVETPIPQNLVDGGGYIWSFQTDGGFLGGATAPQTSAGGVQGALANYSDVSEVLSSADGRLFEFNSTEGFSVDLRRKVYVSEDQAFVRYLDIFTNETDGPRTYRHGVNTDPRFSGGFAKSDDPANGIWEAHADVPNTLNRTAMLAVQTGRGFDMSSYNLELQPGETKIVMHFMVQMDDLTDVAQKAEQLVDLKLGALDYLTAEEASQIVNFTIATPDAYAIEVTAGDLLNIETLTPAGEGGGFVNLLDPQVELYDESGVLVASNDNGASDGRNASLAHTAVTSGTYRVVVSGVDRSQGEYVLNVSGNTPLVPVPATGAPEVIETPEAVEAGDAGESGLSAPASAVADTTPPRIIASSIQEGDSLTGDSFIFTAQFSEELDEYWLSYRAISLVGDHVGEIETYYDGYGYDPVTSTLTFEFRNVPEDAYTLTLPSGIYTIRDLAGNYLDGEAITFPIPGNVTGNGIAGGSFVVHFTVDHDVEKEIPTLVAKQPVGASIYERTVHAVVGVGGDSDSHTIDLNAGELATFVVNGQGDLIPHVELTDASGTLLAEATATEIGGAAILQTVAIPTTGTYTVTVTGAVFVASTADADGDGDVDTTDIMTAFANYTGPIGAAGGKTPAQGDVTPGPHGDGDVDVADIMAMFEAYTGPVEAGTPSTGGYSLQTILNAQAEGEASTGASNDDLASAQNIDGGFAGFGSGKKAAVLGNMSAAASSPGEDFYRFTLQAGESASVVLTPQELASFEVELLDATGTLLAKGHTTDGSALRIDNFVAPATGEFYVRVVGGDGDEYGLAVLVDAILETSNATGSADAATETGGNTTIFGSVKPNDGGVTVGYDVPAPEWLIDGEGFSYEDFNDAQLWPPTIVSIDPDADRESFDGYPELLTVSMDGRQAVSSRDVEAVVYTNNDYVNRDTKRYVPDDQGYVRILETVTNHSYYTIDVSLYASHDRFGVPVDGVLSSSGDSTFDTNDQWIVFDDEAEGGSAAAAIVVAGLDGMQPAVVVQESGLYGDVEYQYDLRLAPGESKSVMHLVTMGNSQEEVIYKAQQLANLGLDVLEGLSPEELSRIENFQIDPGDAYRVEVNAGDVLSIDTMTPSSGPLRSNNGLDPYVQLYDPTGVLVAADDNGAGDFRNAAFTHTASMSGTYILKVSGAARTGGDYVVNIQGASGSANAFEVAAVTPADGEPVGQQPTYVTLDFSDDVYLPSVDASDFSIGGLAPLSVISIDGDTLQLEVPAVGEGIHAVEVTAGSILNLQGDSLSGFSSELVVDETGPSVIATSLSSGDMVPAGNLVFFAEFDEELAVGFDASAIELVGQATGSHVPTSIAYDPVSSRLAVEYSSLPEDSFTLTLRSGDGYFEDLVGNDLAGLALPLPPLPATAPGGAVGNDVVIQFGTDVLNSEVELTLEPEHPLGSLVYSGQASRAIGVYNDVDQFEVDVDAGLYITVAVEPSATLQPRVQLIAPNGSSLGDVSASGVGSAAVLQSVPATTAGTYVVRVLGGASSYGSYDLQFVLNAAIEEESLGLGLNNDTATAQNIDSSFLPLGSGAAERAAVLGSNSIVQVSQLEHRSSSIFYRCPHDFAIDATLPSSGDAVLTISTIADLEATNEYIDIDIEGIITDTIFVNDGLYRSLVTATITISEAEMALLVADGVIDVSLEPTYYVSDVSSGMIEVGLDYEYTPAETTDVYEFTLDAGQATTLVANGGSNDDLVLELLDTSGNWLADGVVTPVGDVVVDQFVAPTTGTYYARVTGLAGPMSLIVTRDAIWETAANNYVGLESQHMGAGGAVLGHVSPGGFSSEPLVTTPGSLSTTITDGDGYDWEILTQGQIYDRTAWTNFRIMENDDFGQNFYTADFATDRGQHIELGPQLKSGIETVRKLYIPDDQGYVRYLDIVTNTTASPVNYLLKMESHLAAGSTTWVDTSSGDHLLDDSDNWIVASSPSLGEGYLPYSMVFAGPGGQRPSEMEFPPSGYRLDDNYELALQPGETQIVMHFVAKAEDQAAAIAKAEHLVDLEMGALHGITEQERQLIVNFEIDATDVYTVDVVAGSTISITTATPADGPLEYENTLDPFVQLYDPSGTLVAFDDNSAVDGRNVSLTHVATATGTYSVQVSGQGSTGGEYVLEVGQTALPPAPLQGASVLAPAAMTASPTTTLTTSPFQGEWLLASREAAFSDEQDADEYLPTAKVADDSFWLDREEQLRHGEEAADDIVSDQYFESLAELDLIGWDDESERLEESNEIVPSLDE